uniref:Uncharacterized protein n=1 Tax=Anguilla anguilla TaxID=7936 RepID=A0A0E9UY28_ANGAN
MKLFVVLALVAFTDCQANVLRSDEPKPQLDLVKDALLGLLCQGNKNSSRYSRKPLETLRLDSK